jgi:hypothetical protein
MSFTVQYFGKALANITTQDILNFFSTPRYEDHHLEFKSGQVRMDKILKEVSAFLNADGGLIIIGSPREMEVAAGQQPPTLGLPDPSFIESEDALHEAIRQMIQPHAGGIHIGRVPYMAGFVYLVEIKPSPAPPHQVGPVGTYYVRDGAVSRPANHIELERLFFEKRMPDLLLKIALVREVDYIQIHLSIINQSTKAADLPYVNVQVAPVLAEEGNRFEQKIYYHEPYLPKGVEWQEELKVAPQNPVIYLRVDFCCKDAPLKTKAAFVNIRKSDTELLQVYDSEAVMHFNANDFYYQYSYLLG